MTILQTGTILWALPVIQLLSCLPAACRARTPFCWAVAEASALVSAAIALVAAAFAILQNLAHAVAADAQGQMMVLLVSVLGWAIIRFSRRYLGGEPGQHRYVCALTLTLSAVSIVALTDHLGLLVLAWVASSISLHHLLVFYPDRRAAQIVAHKKFLASRLADLCLAFALVLIYRETGTLSIRGIGYQVGHLVHLSPALHAAMLAVVLAAILKSAQLPFHGWLIQVMEAPTPVSALLHAGIVNLGGFVLIRLAALLSAAPLAQAVLVIVGSLSAVLAGLVMMTRISIKVRLAWSTCAQMGFMLMECGLGLYDLAFLHLVAHSLYKAHAFLTAGETVLAARRRELLPSGAAQASPAVLASRLAAFLVSPSIVAASGLPWHWLVPGFAMPVAVIALVGLGLAPLLWLDDARPTNAATVLRGFFSVVIVTQLYIVWHLGFGSVLGIPPGSASVGLMWWAAGCFVTLYVLQTWLISFPRGRLSCALYPWAFAGFYLDERFTRLTFRLWPARLRAAVPGGSTNVLSGGRA